jgi:single-stranded DNA-binding protein
MNNVQLIGRITGDSKNGVFRLAINRGKDKTGKEVTDFIPVFTNREKLEPYLTKGKLVAVTGYIHSYQKDKKTELIVVAQKIEFLEKKKEEPEVIEAEPETEPPQDVPW